MNDAPSRRRAPIELRLLAVLAAGALLVLALVALTDEVREGGTQGFDERVLLAFRQPGNPALPRGPEWLADAARDVTALGSGTVLALVVVAVLGFLLLARRRRLALLVALAGFGAMNVSPILKHLVDRPRPIVVAHLVPVHSLSFPSGHATASAAVYLSLAALVARVQTRRGARLYALGVAFLLTTLVGLSRMYLGVHYPSDVVAGWAAGALWALLCSSVVLGLQRRGAVSGPSPPGDATPPAKG